LRRRCHLVSGHRVAGARAGGRAALRRHPAVQGVARQPPGAGGGAPDRQSRSGALMLYWLTQKFARADPFFNVLQYVTLPPCLAVITALAISWVIGPGMIRWLSRYQVGQVVRNDGPQTHLKKAGTPTMGGTLIIVAICIATLLWADLSNRFVWIVLGVLLLCGLVGFYDDYLKLVVKNTRGLAPRWKYLWLS